MSDDKNFDRYIQTALHKQFYESEQEFQRKMLGSYEQNFEHQYSASEVSDAARHVERLEHKIRDMRQDNHELKMELQQIQIDITSEHLLRQAHPGLQELWNEYQTMLDLVKDHK